MPYLIVNAGMPGCEFYCFVAKVSIGRHLNNDIVLSSDEDKRISRCHAAIEHDGEGYVLIDSSLNGTFIDDKMIDSYRLRHGDQFQIAQYHITFIDDAAVASPSRHRQGITPQAARDFGNAKTRRVKDCDAVHRDISDTQLKEKLKTRGIIVEDENMLALYRDIYLIARIDVSILILGEPGTGKEKVAQAIHDFSEAKGQFIALNCSAIPDNLFESELFGSVKGAFSVATTKSGKLEAADKGTLFLDEIGDMSITSMPKLLRFLETSAISRLGETRLRQLNSRIVAATNQDLKHMISIKAFRPDLYHRLACVKFNIPPLHQRKKDILPLADFFLANYARQYGFNPKKISSQASRIMLSYRWPGNVRELANLMLNVSVCGSGSNIMPDSLTKASEEIGSVDIGKNTDFISLKEMEKNHIIEALKQADNNKTKACAMLGIVRDTLYKKMRKYGIG